MSGAAQIQQPQTQLPVVVYPNTITGQAPPSPHSNGSFGPVFIVLAVIIAMSAIACFLGQLCNRRFGKQKPPKQNHHAGQRQHGQNHNGFRPKESDIEFGFNTRMPSPVAAKPVGHGDLRGFRMPEYGDFRVATKPADGGEL